jgi:hypothetical protein
LPQFPLPVNPQHQQGGGVNRDVGRLDSAERLTSRCPRAVSGSLRRPARAGLAAVPALAVAVLVLDAAVPVLPDDPLVTVLTPQRLIVAAGLAAWFAGGGRLRDLRTRLDVTIAVLVLAGTLATVRGGFEPAPTRALLTDVALFYLVVAALRGDRQAREVVALSALVAVTIPAAVALAQFTDGVPTGFCRSPSFEAVRCAPGLLVRSTGTFANPNLLAAYLVLLAPLAATAVPALGSASSRALGVGLVALAYAGVVVAFSRSAYVGVAAGSLAAAVAVAARRPGWRRPLAAAAAAGGGVVIAVVALGVVGRETRRSEPWSLALQVAERHPAGVGLGRAGEVMTAVGQPPEPLFHAHNLWLNWLVEGGLLGLAAAVTLTATALATAARNAATARSPGAIAVLASLLGFLVISLVDHPANSDRVASALWVVLALAVAPDPPARLRRRREAVGDTTPRFGIAIRSRPNKDVAAPVV